MGIEHGYDVDRVLWLGRQLERTVGTVCEAKR
jgi:hydroxymethylglutaryl-CoA lyase